MDIVIFGHPRLERWERRPYWPAIEGGPRERDHRDVYQAEVAREPLGPPVPGGPYRAVAEAILAYRIFPPSLVRGLLRRTPAAEGDTIGIRYQVLPGAELFFAARVIACFDGEDGPCFRTGFTYRTLVGHPELGEETFAVEKSLADGRVTAVLRSWSRPGTLLSRIGAPLVRRLQISASHAALVHLQGIAAGTIR